MPGWGWPRLKTQPAEGGVQPVVPGVKQGQGTEKMKGVLEHLTDYFTTILVFWKVDFYNV